MPVYNGAAHLDEAITSVLHQTFQDFEFIIVNDGSTDGTTAIVERYEKLDPRIRSYHQPNRGMIAALNLGCRASRGKYIARMDADDVCFVRRLERQLAYIEARPQIGILGTWISRIKTNGTPTGNWCPSANSNILKWHHFFGVCVCHPSVLMRREVLEKVNFYRWDALYADDRDLWLRASKITEFSNVPEILLKYRVWNESASQRHQNLLKDVQVKLLTSYIRNFLQSEFPVEAVAGLQRRQWADVRHIGLSSRLLQSLYQKFMAENNLTYSEKREISWDAAKRMASLAIQASRIDARASVPLFARAIQTDYRLLMPSALMKGLKRSLSADFR